jgi:hypothetical protein
LVSVNRRFAAAQSRPGVGQSRRAFAVRARYHASAGAHRADFLRFTAIHALDAVRFIAGNVSAFQIRALKPMPPQWYAIDLQFESGVRGRIDVLPTAGLLEETYELMGDGFRSVITCPFGLQRSLHCYQENRLVLDEIAGSETSEDVINGFYGEVIELVQALTNQQRPKPSIEDVFPLQLCFQMADQVEKNEAASFIPAAS